MEDVNRLKLVLVEKKCISKWLAEQLGVNPSTVSKWSTNTFQSDLATILKIADLLGGGYKRIICKRIQTISLITGKK